VDVGVAVEREGLRVTAAGAADGHAVRDQGGSVPVVSRLNVTVTACGRAVVVALKSTVLASCDRGRIALRRLPRGNLLRAWVSHEDVVHDVGLSPDGRALLSVGRDG
jgi:hypothetical protein